MLVTVWLFVEAAAVCGVYIEAEDETFAVTWAAGAEMRGGVDAFLSPCQPPRTLPLPRHQPSHQSSLTLIPLSHPGTRISKPPTHSETSAAPSHNRNLLNALLSRVDAHHTQKIHDAIRSTYISLIFSFPLFSLYNIHFTALMIHRWRGLR